MRRLGFLLLLLLAPLAQAQEVATANWAVNYNLDATVFTYCRVNGQNGNPYSGQITGPSQIKTTGSNTAVTEVAAGSGPFAGLAAKDTIYVRRPDGTTDVRQIVTFTDASNIVVDQNVDWSAGFSFTYTKTVCGTTVNDGWIDVTNYSDKNMTVEYNQGDLGGGLDARWECKGAGPTATPVIVYPSKGDTCGQGTQTVNQQCNFPTAGIGAANRIAVVAYEPWQACRVGLKAATNDPSDAGANMERINVYFQGRLRH